MTKEEQQEIIEALRKTELAHTELFKELGNKVAGDWGIINDGLVAFNGVRRKLEPKAEGGE
jgi:hypothetical protein